MENEDLIRNDMKETRTAMTDKLETLEQKVGGATTAVTDTVQAIKDSVTDTVATVKETVQDSAKAVKDWFNITGHVQEHPWMFFGGSVALGYFLGSVRGNAPQKEPSQQPSVSPPKESSVKNALRHPRMGLSQKAPVPSAPNTLFHELGVLKSMAIGALFGTARELITNAVPAAVKPQLMEIFEKVSKKADEEKAPESEWARDLQAHAGGPTDNGKENPAKNPGKNHTLVS